MSLDDCEIVSEMVQCLTIFGAGEPGTEEDTGFQVGV